MNKSIAGTIAVLGGLMLFSAGCATTGHKGALSKQTARTPKKTAVSSKQTGVAPQTAVRPEWVSKKMDYWVQGREILVRGSSIDSDKAAAVKVAESVARVKLAKNVRDLMLAEFQREVSVRKADAKTREALATSFNSVAGKMKIEGIRTTNVYTEKTGIGARKGNIDYRAFALVKISMTDYDKCLRQTLAALKEQVSRNKKECRLVEAINADLPDTLL